MPQWIHESHAEPVGLVTRLSARLPEMSDTAEVHWALLADPHVSADLSRDYNGLRPAEHAREAIAAILAAGCRGGSGNSDRAPGAQAALIAGDLAWNEGLPGDYAQLMAILEPLAARIPVALTLGNHDSRSTFLAEFSLTLASSLGRPDDLHAALAAQKVLTVIEHGPIRWILLDSLFRTDIVAGLLGKAQRCWLRGLLETSDPRPTLIVVHHPLNDGDDSLLDSDRLLGLVQPFPQVKAILTAHDHAYRLDSREGIHIVALPALGMPFDAAEPVGWIEASLTSTGAALVFHAVGRNCSRDQSVTTLDWR